VGDIFLILTVCVLQFQIMCKVINSVLLAVLLGVALLLSVQGRYISNSKNISSKKNLWAIDLSSDCRCYTAVKMRWHTCRNQISSFREMDKST
jgi:hypothetical protein